MNTRMYSKNRTALVSSLKMGFRKVMIFLIVAMAETKIKTDTQELPFLLKEGETVDIKTDIKKTLKARPGRRDCRECYILSERF